jgi:vitamin B12 transporter
MTPAHFRRSPFRRLRGRKPWECFMKPLLLIGALAAPAVVHAQTAVPAKLDPVVVTATGKPTALGDTLAPLLVLTREDIVRAQALDLAELLRFYAGIEIGRNGGPGAVTSVFVRGGESNHTLVLIDGIRMNPATSGGAAWQNIAPEMIERIEIVKGPRASLYGSDAIAGVVNVITRQAAQGPKVDLSLRGGSDATWDAAASGSWGTERGSVSLQAQHLRTDGFPALVGQTRNTGYDRTSLNLDTRAQFGTATLGARIWDSAGTSEYYGYDPVDFSRVVVEQDYRNQVAAVDASLPIGEHLRAQVRASRMQDDIEQQQSEDYVETVRSGFDAELIWNRGAQRISGGASFVREDVEANSFGSLIDERRDIATLRLQDELGFGRHHAVAGVSWSDYDGFGNRWDGSLDYGFDVTPSARIVASAGTGFRAPDATDRFGFGGNPDLDPERARNFELGWQQRVGDDHRVDLRLFRSDVDDLINLLCDENFNCTAVNVDRYRNEGVELSYHLRTAIWSATLTGLLQDPVDRSSDRQLLRRAKRTVALRVSRDFGIWDAGFDVLGSGDRPDVSAETGAPVTAPGYALLNLHAGLRLGTSTELRLRLENVFDKDYETAAGFAQPDASIYVGLRYSL